MSPSHIFSVPAGLLFMKTCVRALLDNQLIAGADMRDPLLLADIQIFVPSRRAARILRSAFVEESPDKASFLPSMRPLGEAEDSDFLSFAAAYEQDLPPENAAEAEAMLTQPAPIAPLERQALLARLIRPWREKLPAHIRALFGRETIEVPSNTADALWLARNLASLMDEIETEGADSSAIKNIAPEDLAEWWQVTTEFLDLVFSVWPEILAERGQTTAAAARNASLRHEGELLADERSKTRRENNKLLSMNRDKPILVLGSTGSVPAAAELIKQIAARPNSAIVLPGLDRDLDDKAWDSLDKDADNPALFTHPQFMLKRLLARLGVMRGAVTFLGNPSAPERAREKAVSEIFRPAGSTEEWQRLRELRSELRPDEQGDKFDGRENSFNHISLIEAATAREEALSIAAALREALEEQGRTAALITNDRVLARRVCTELARFGAEANDSGGAPLSETEPLTMLRLLMACIFNPGDSVALLALLKHPLTRLGFARADLRRQVEQFEFFALRGGTGRINIADAESFMEERLQKLTELENVNTDFTAARIEEAMRLASCLTAACAPLSRFAEGADEIRFEQAVIATVETLENFGRDEQKNLSRLYAQEQGQALINFFRKLLADRSGLTFMPQEWPQILDALLADETAAMRQSGHPRLFILGLFEARLQNFDTVLIGGLNEGSLPHNPKNSPFMSRQMKAALGLPPPEQKIGFTAHDMAQAFAAKQVILSRALRVDNAPSVASRWLQRLQTVAGDAANAAMRARGAFYLRAAQNLDNAPSLPFAPRPCPKPALALRPKQFSITEIETLRRDPYAVYAKRILRLKPLEPLIADAGAAERGTLFHAVLAGFSQFYPHENIAPIEEQALKQLTLIAEAELAKLQLPPDIAVLWRPRLLSLLPNYLQWEAGLSQRRRFAEISADKTEIDGTGCFIRGRADRIDIAAGKDENGETIAEIMDFKTGSNPDKKYARLLSAPQLALEGALLARGSFRDCGKALADKLYYIRLKADGSVQAEDIAAVKIEGEDKDAQSLAEEAWRRLAELMRHFQRAETGYLSHALPSLGSYGSDYDHLARVAEWSSSAGEGDE